MAEALRIIPLGGLGEIGLNMMVIESGGAAIAIDCGVLFPERPGLGIDLLLPDVSYIESHPGMLKAVVLTHGHEDHIGALPRLLRKLEVPIFGPRLAIELVREKLRRNGLTGSLEVLDPGSEIKVGPFTVEAIHITHSIVDACALAIGTPQGMIIHSGDFKLDPDPLDGRLADTDRIGELARRGVLLLLSDSTNVESEGSSASESTVGPRIAELLRTTTGRAYITTFSSHLHRLQQVIDASQSCGREVVVAGRGLEDSTRLATSLGYLKLPRHGLLGTDQLEALPRGATTVVISGSQGEPNSALNRLSEGQFRGLDVAPGDGVIFSSRTIPGNERPVHALLNRLSKRGAEIHRGERDHVHVSGHAHREELRTLITLVKPRYFVPIHGEYRHLAEHRRLAVESGMDGGACFVLEDGDVLEIEGKSVKRGERVVAGRVAVDGTGEGDVGPEILRERRHLSEDGIVIAVLAIHAQTGELTSGPELIMRGVVGEANEAAVREEARQVVLASLRGLTPESRADLVEAEDGMRRALKRYFSRTLGRRPLIVPHVFEM